MSEGFSKEKGLKVKEFNRIKELYKKGEYDLVKENLINFLNKYPNDNLGWHYYAKLLMREKDYNEALMILENNQPEENFMMQIDIVKCYIALQRYEESYLLASLLEPFTENKYSKKFLRRAIIYSLSNLEQQERLELKDLDYYEEQMLKYNKNKTVEFLKKEQSINPTFQEYIDLEKLIDEIEPLLQETESLSNTATLTDTYLFNYPNIGIIEGKTQNILQVVTIHDTHQILKVAPVVEYKKYPKTVIHKGTQLTEKVLKKDIK